MKLNCITFSLAADKLKPLSLLPYSDVVSELIYFVFCNNIPYMHSTLETLINQKSDLA